MDYTEYFRELADYYNRSRLHCKVMTGAAEIRCHINFINHVPLEILPTFVEIVHQRLEPGSTVFCASQRYQGSPEEPWYKKADTGDMVSLRHHDDGRPIEVVDTLFTEDRLKEVFAGKAREPQITMKPWWWWASYEGVSYRAAVTDHSLVSC